MKKAGYRYCVCLILMLVWNTSMHSQNLVPNPSFEVNTGCPDDIPPFDICELSWFDSMQCVPWKSWDGNYFNACASWPCNVPDNFKGYQEAQDGNAYVGGYLYDEDMIGMGYREIFQVALLEPLVAGECYEVSFYLNLADSSYGCGISHIGVYFTQGEGDYWGELLGTTPQIEAAGQFYSDMVNWTHVVGHFVAEGGEDHLTVGNFREQEECVQDPGCSDPEGDLDGASYYYFDSFVVQLSESGDPFTIDLGGPYTACDYYLLTVPEFPDAHYSWSNGYAGPAIPITESGTYSVTVSSHCQTAEGTAEVTILGSPPVSLGFDIEMCEGESVTISLDAFAGEYEWSDGSTDNEYVISTGGIHSVTLDDGCGLTFDEVEVTVNPVPDFSLGEDTILCSGQSISIVFDPVLGDFHWQDGSTGFFNFIDEPGEYALTISNDCGSASDEIVVEEGMAPEFDLEPDSAFLCAGESLSVILDEELGDFIWQDGNTGPSYEISAPGLYSVTVSNACGAVSDQMHVTGINFPEFDLGGPLYFCIGESLYLEVPDIYGNYTWQDGSTDNVYEVSSPGTYALTITNDCGTYSDIVVVEYEPGIAPPDLGPDQGLCPEGEILLVIDPTDDDILWSDLSTDDTLLVSLPGTYSVSVFTECGTYSDTIVITIDSDGPQLNLPEEMLLCQGDTILIDANIGTASYQWSDGSTDPQIEVFSQGQYALTVTNACGSDIDTFNVEVIPSSFLADLGVDFSLCPGETGILYANIAEVDYQWSTSAGNISTADSLIITGPDTYILEISNQCGVSSDTVVVTVDSNPPDVDLPVSVDLCQGDTVLIDAGVTGVQYLWSDSTQLSSLSITTPGSYSLTVNNACGSDADTITINDAGSEPFVDLGIDIFICEGESITLLPTFAFVNTWLWPDGSNDYQYEVSTEGPVVVEVSNACGQFRDSIYVTMLPATPLLDLGNDLSICPGETIILSINEPNVSIEWHDASTNPEFVVSNAGLVFATISNACSFASDTVLVSLSDAAPALDLGADQSLCPGETIIFDPGIANVEYLWSDGSNATTFQTTQPGTIILTISNDCGSATDTVEIIEDTNGPQLDLGPDILACEGEIVTLASGISGVMYTWQDGSDDPDYLATESGTYILQVSNACGSDADTVLVDIHGTTPAPSLGPDTALCDGEVLVLLSDAGAETFILWQDFSTEQEFIVTQAGVYSLQEMNHCGSGSDTIVVSYTSSPLPFNLGTDVVLCSGDSIVLNAPLTTDMITWHASTGSATMAPTFVVDTVTTVTLMISNDCGAETDQINVTFDQQVPVVELGETVSLCPDAALTLDVSQPFIATYLWNTGSAEPSILITLPDLYAVTVSTDCYSTTDEVVIEENADCDEHEVFIPNVFSPNGDNINDEWVIVPNDLNVVGIECNVFDRWGDLVYQSDDSPIVWDGTFNGKNVMPGVYVYLVKLTDNNGDAKILSGDLTVVR